MRYFFLIATSIIFVIILTLNYFIGFIHSNIIINILIYVLSLAMIIRHVMISFQKETLIKKILSCFICFILLFLSLITVIKNFSIYYGIIYMNNQYIFPENQNEKLYKITYDDGGLSGPSYVIYRKEFILGFSCNIKIKESAEYKADFNLEEIYEQLKINNKLPRDCYYN